MKTIDLYLKVLKDVRYKTLNTGFTLSDFEPGSNAYDLLCSVNEACNTLSDLITIMKFEDK